MKSRCMFIIIIIIIIIMSLGYVNHVDIKTELRTVALFHKIT